MTMFSNIQQPEIILNDDQNRAVFEAVNRVLRHDLNPIEISGGPGTGKSVVLNEIKNKLNYSPQRIAPMAYIGQAACVMRLKGFPNARTMHSWLYEPVIEDDTDDDGRIKYDPHMGTRVKKSGFRPIEHLPNIDIMFIDEGYSMPRRHLFDIMRHRVPVVTAGDPNQLPPVGDHPAFLTDPSKIIYLRQVMRQKENSGILYLAQRALHGLPIHKGFYGDAIVIYDDELDNNTLLGADCIITTTNKTRERINLMIRDILGYKGDLPNFGERVICRKNNFNIEVDGIGLANGLLGTVANQPNVSTFDGKSFQMDFKPDLCRGKFENIVVDYEYFNAPLNYKDQIKKRPYCYGEYFDWGYAITSHLGQGGQWDKVIFFEDWLPHDTEKVNFVAATRAAKALIWVKKRPKMY